MWTSRDPAILTVIAYNNVEAVSRLLAHDPGVLTRVVDMKEDEAPPVPWLGVETGLLCYLPQCGEGPKVYGIAAS